MPRNRQANAVKSKAGQIRPPENDKIKDVTLIPRPVIDKTPITIEAQRMIEAIIAICLPAVRHASHSFRTAATILNFNLASKDKRQAATKMATAAAYCGVKP